MRCGLTVAAITLAASAARAGEPPAYDLRRETAVGGFDGKTCWVHARAGMIPGDPPTAVMTLQKLLLSGSDVFYGIHVMTRLGRDGTWTAPQPQRPFQRRKEAAAELTVCDFVPAWHEQTGVLLGTGQTVRYVKNRVMPDRPRQVAYATWDPAVGAWRPWLTVALPDEPAFYSTGAGSGQRWDLPDGRVLLPVYYKASGRRCYNATVLLCRFDGRELTCIERGTALKHDVPRGYCEPSLARFRDRFYLTLRNDRAGYVAAGDDGLHFPKPVPWRFDDGKPLGNYNTQQHWVVGPRGLYLVYTRRGAHNDHVFRHRAPLLMARVDTAHLRVVRATERILVPERGARLGNFGVCRVDDRETWVTAAEWMQPRGCEKRGADNSVHVARIQWRKANDARENTP